MSIRYWYWNSTGSNYWFSKTSFPKWLAKNNILVGGINYSGTRNHPLLQVSLPLLIDQRNAQASMWASYALASSYTNPQTTRNTSFKKTFKMRLKLQQLWWKIIVPDGDALVLIFNSPNDAFKYRWMGEYVNRKLKILHYTSALLSQIIWQSQAFFSLAYYFDNLVLCTYSKRLTEYTIVLLNVFPLCLSLSSSFSL